MIISRTPLRISFLGGGTDYPQWYEHHEGAILGTTIDKYCYVMLHDGKSWRTFDLPMKAGLGSSSAYTVGLLRACTELDGLTISRLATVWEQDKLGGNIGSQDQYLCATGGFHLLRFNEHGIRDTVLAPEVVEPLASYLMLFNSHQYRLAGDVVAYQLAEMKKHQKLYVRLTGMVIEGVAALKSHDYREFGKLLDEGWSLKRQLSKRVSTSAIDAIYDTAIKAGAIGGKLLGAGGGGFFIFLAQPDKQGAIREVLSDLQYVPFGFDYEGAKVIYHDEDSHNKS